MEMVGPGIFAPNISAAPSSGCSLSTSALGVSASVAVSRNSDKGGRLNWITISLLRLAIALPVRR